MLDLHINSTKGIYKHYAVQTCTNKKMNLNKQKKNFGKLVPSNVTFATSQYLKRPVDICHDVLKTVYNKIF